MIEVIVKGDGVWIRAEHDGKTGLINLNHIVNSLKPTIVRAAFVGAINAARPKP